MIYQKKNKFRVVMLMCFIFVSIITIFYAIFSLLDFNNIRLGLNLKVHVIFGLVLLIIFLISWKIATGRFFSPVIMLIGTFYLFQSGQTFLYGIFNISNIDLLNKASMEELIETQCFFNLSFGFLIMGISGAAIFDRPEYKIKKLGINTLWDNEYLCDQEMRLLRSVGLVLLALTIIPKNYFSLISARASILYGYAAVRPYVSSIIESNILMRIGKSISEFYIPSLYMCIVGYSKKPRAIRCLFALLIINAVLQLITGGRAEALSSLLVIIWVWTSYIKNYSNKQKLIIIILGLLCIILIPTIQKFRQLEQKDFSSFVASFQSMASSGDIFIELISEMGGSAYPLILIMRNVPAIRGFGYGSSYIMSFFSVIPDTFLFGLDYKKYTNLQEWLTYDVLGQISGTGFSICAEAYFNFSWLGVFLFIIIGNLYYKFFYSAFAKRGGMANNPASLVVSICLLDETLLIARGQFVGLVRQGVYILLICGLISKIAKNSLKKAKQMNESIIPSQSSPEGTRLINKV